MKLRIHGNSIRIRLSPSDLKLLEEEGVVSQEIHFPNAEKLEYELVISDNYGADLAGYRMTITIPRDAVSTWIHSEELSLEASLDLGGGDKLMLLVEKDLHTQ